LNFEILIYSNLPQNCIPLNTKIVIGNVKNFFSHSAGHQSNLIFVTNELNVNNAAKSFNILAVRNKFKCPT